MKSPTKTLAKLAALFVVLGAAATALAQSPRLDTSQLNALAAKASNTVDVNLDENLIQLSGKFLSSKDPDEAKVKDLVNGLKGVYVKGFTFENEGAYSEADLEGIRSQLRNAAWNKIVNVNTKNEGRVEVYLMKSGSQIGGLTVVATAPKEITIVNIIGPVDLEKLSELEGMLGVPELGIGRANQLAPDITVVSVTWRYPVNWLGDPTADVLSGSSSRDTVARDPQGGLDQKRKNNELGPIDTERDLYLKRGQNEAIVEIQNNSAKKIKAVSYTFLFVNRGDETELLRYQFHNRIAIPPGQTKTMTNQVADRRAKRFSPGGTSKVEYRVVVNRVEFADGSMWQRQ